MVPQMARVGRWLLHSSRLVGAVDGLGTCRWLAHERSSLFLSMDKVFGMLGLLLAGLKVVGRWFTDGMTSFWLLKEFCMCLTSFVRTGLTELGFATHPRQAYGIREAQKEAEGPQTPYCLNGSSWPLLVLNSHRSCRVSGCLAAMSKARMMALIVAHYIPL